MAQQKIRIKIPKGISPEDREAIASEVIEYIRDRAQNDGRGFNPDTGREFKFPKYTKDYAKKKGSSFVDLTFDDEMLRAMRLLREESGSITIGYEAGSKENGKAEGNQKGTYGQPRPIPGKARPFLGLPKWKLDEIVEKYADNVDDD